MPGGELGARLRKAPGEAGTQKSGCAPATGSSSRGGGEGRDLAAMLPAWGQPGTGSLASLCLSQI